MAKGLSVFLTPHMHQAYASLGSSGASLGRDTPVHLDQYGAYTMVYYRPCPVSHTVGHLPSFQAEGMVVGV